MAAAWCRTAFGSPEVPDVQNTTAVSSGTGVPVGSGLRWASTFPERTSSRAPTRGASAAPPKGASPSITGTPVLRAARTVTRTVSGSSEAQARVSPAAIGGTAAAASSARRRSVAASTGSRSIVRGPYRAVMPARPA
ncbi:hypothetical protein [Actinomadura sp. J1-007]|uniref:hypothetical protein n=1 Tax=Actinomadura sp. J1-007 TaxID=2661913 RepID=UPI001F4F2081|nr:hypothetical protein [Actinomadura sp. J1-007]